MFHAKSVAFRHFAGETPEDEYPLIRSSQKNKALKMF